MNLHEAFRKLKNANHSESFERIDRWLEKRRPRAAVPSSYKIAASFMLLALVIAACNFPVEHQVELGHRISGISDTVSGDYEAELSAREIGLSHIRVQNVVEAYRDRPVDRYLELEMILPKGSRAEAERQLSLLREIFDFRSVEIETVTDTVNEPLYAAALQKTLNIRITKSEEEIRSEGFWEPVVGERSLDPDDINSIEVLRKDGEVQINVRMEQPEEENRSHEMEEQER